MKYKIYRNSELIATVRPEGNLTASIMGEEVATMDFSTSECVEFKMNDRCEIFGNTYFLSKVLREDKVNERLFNYTLEFVGVKYELGKIAYMFPDASNALTLSEFHIMGKPQMMIDLIVRNANRVGSGWSVGVVDDVEAKQVDFAEDNCLSALAKITSAFNLEYWVDGDKSVHLTKRVGVSGYSFKYGRAKGLRGIGRVPFEGSNIVTRLYAKGSEKNLGSYRNGQRYLRMPVPFLEKNTEKYGIVEHTQSFPDIYPHRIGKVTEVYDDFLKFKDADIDFDLNEKNEHGTVVLIDGVSAKVNFLTGQLAGYTFEIKQYGYNSSDKIFTLLKNKDEKALEVPSEHLRPAVGDTYVLTDIIMPQSYVTAAERKLQEEAQRYLDENCGQRHQYTLIADPIYFENQNVNIQLGNTVRAIDTDFKVDDNLRVTRLVKDLQNPYNVEFDVAERAVIAHVVRDYVEAEKARTAIVKKERYNAEMARRSWNFAREISDNIFDQDGYFDSEKIKPLSIDTSLLTVGSRSQQFELPNVLLTVEENDTAVRNTAGQIVHLTIADKPRKWEIPANVQRGIGIGYHFIYVKAQKEGENASIYVSDEQLPVDGEDFYYFLAGSLGSIDNGFRRIKTAYGFSQVSPGEITTGRISSPNGQNYIELLQDRININASVEFSSNSPAFNQMSDSIQPKIDEVKNQGNLYVRSTISYNPKDFPRLKIGDEMVYNGWSLGYKLVKIDRATLSAELVGTYDMYNSKEENANRLIEDLNSIDDSFIICLFSSDSMAWKDIDEEIQANLISTFQKFGSSITTLKDVWISRSHILIGINGIGIGKGIEVSNKTEPIEISTKIINGLPIGIGADYYSDIEAAKKASKAYTDAQDEQKEITIKAYADGKVTQEERKRIKALEKALRDAEAKARELDNALKSALKKEIQDVDTALTTFKNVTFESFKDGIIDKAEKEAIKSHKELLANESADIVREYESIYNDDKLQGDAKSELLTAKNDYQSKYNTLITAIDNAIRDNKITSSERTAVENGFTNYRDALVALRNALNVALDAIADAKFYSIETGGNILSDYKFQLGKWNLKNPLTEIDGKSVAKINSLFNDYISNVSIEKGNYSICLIARRGSEDGLFRVKFNRQNKSYYFKLTEEFELIKIQHFQDRDTIEDFHIMTNTSSEFYVHSVAIFKGNVGGYPIPSQEDYENAVQAVADKTDFLHKAVTDGPVVATGTLMVGNETGATAGITGVKEIGKTMEESTFLWSGSNFPNRGDATTRITNGGKLYAKDAYMSGEVHATSGSFTGEVHATSGSFTGEVHANSGDFTGEINATSGKIANFTITKDELKGVDKYDTKDSLLIDGGGRIKSTQAGSGGSDRTMNFRVNDNDTLDNVNYSKAIVAIESNRTEAHGLHGALYVSAKGAHNEKLNVALHIEGNIRVGKYKGYTGNHNNGYYVNGILVGVYGYYDEYPE